MLSFLLDSLFAQQGAVSKDFFIVFPFSIAVARIRAILSIYPCLQPSVVAMVILFLLSALGNVTVFLALVTSR